MTTVGGVLAAICRPMFSQERLGFGRTSDPQISLAVTRPHLGPAPSGPQTSASRLQVAPMGSSKAGPCDADARHNFGPPPPWDIGPLSRTPLLGPQQKPDGAPRRSDPPDGSLSWKGLPKKRHTPQTHKFLIMNGQPALIACVRARAPPALRAPRAPTRRAARTHTRARAAHARRCARAALAARARAANRHMYQEREAAVEHTPDPPFTPHISRNTQIGPGDSSPRRTPAALASLSAWAATLKLPPPPGPTERPPCRRDRRRARWQSTGPSGCSGPTHVAGRRSPPPRRAAAQVIDCDTMAMSLASGPEWLHATFATTSQAPAHIAPTRQAGGGNVWRTERARRLDVGKRTTCGVANVTDALCRTLLPNASRRHTIHRSEYYGCILRAA